MEFLNILKKHYEKVILSVVLLALAVASAMLVLRVAAERERLDEVRHLPMPVGTRELVPVDVSTNLTTLARIQRPTPVRLSGTNNLFNPVPWQRRADDRLVKMVTGDEMGAGALEITAIRPLHLIVSFVDATRADGLPQYRFRIEREAAPTIRERRPENFTFTSVGSRNAGLLLREIRTPQDPRTFVFESLEDKSEVVVRVDEPHRAVVAHTVDLRYDADGRPSRLPPDRRVGDSITIAGDPHKIVAITATNVTVEASNRKRTTIRYHAGSPASF
jgi:hypothetical protein